MKLSILICSIHSRAAQLRDLLGCLYKQQTPDVEILIDNDQGQKDIGRKRNDLLKLAKNEYVVFIDDDDSVTNTYISRILSAIESNPDVVGMKGIITFDGNNPKVFIHSITCKLWCEVNEIYYRTPNHLNPIKREIALQVMFPETNYGEDKSFSDNVRHLLKTEVMIEEPIYFYRYSESGSASNKKK